MNDDTRAIGVRMISFDYQRKQVSWLPTLRNAMRAGRLAVFACRNTHLRLTRGCLTGAGQLFVGCQWPDGAHRLSQLVVKRGGRCVLEGDFRIFEGAMMWVNPGAVLTLGSGYANSGLSMSVFESVSIGHGVAIGENVTIRDSDNHRIKDRPGGPSAPITIGNRVWIGMNATILKGVTIGDGAAIAAGAVVNRNIPPGMLAAGVPARPVRPVVWE